MTHGRPLLLVLLLLLASTGESLMCHESTCLDDESLTSCAFNNETVLKECDVDVFRDASRRMNRPLHRIVTNLPMTCIKIEEQGFIGGERQTGVVRMCYLDLPEICKKLAEDPTDLVEQHSQPLDVKCSTCSSYACNDAGPSSMQAAFLTVVTCLILALVAAAPHRPER